MRNRKHLLYLFGATIVCLTLGTQLVPQARAQKAAVQPAPQRKSFMLRTSAELAIRFKPATGETWLTIPVAGRWLKLEESGKIPAGDYDVILTGNNDWPLLRINHATGASWFLKIEKQGFFANAKWTKIEEPKE
jgi:hypothetical protein